MDTDYKRDQAANEWAHARGRWYVLGAFVLVALLNLAMGSFKP